MAQECFVCGAVGVLPLRTHDLISAPRYFVFCSVACKAIMPINQKEYLAMGTEYAGVEK